MKKIIAVLLTAALLIMSLPLSIFTLAETPPILVVTNGFDNGAGSLRDIIALAANGETITFAPNVKTITLTRRELSFSLENLTIDGGAGVTIRRSTADGTPEFRIINSTAPVGTLTLKGLTIENGKASISGGGVYVSSSATLSNCTISDSIAANLGGGIYVGNIANFENCTISNNTSSSHGGGAYVTNDATLSKCTISRNTTTGNGSEGGGIYVNANVALTNSTVSGNEAYYAGGGVWVAQNASLINCIVSENIGKQYGGGLFVGNDANLLNSTISSNVVTVGDGGGICSNKAISLTNCTVSSNTAQMGGGILSHRIISLTNSTVSGNIAQMGGGLYASLFTVKLSGSIVSGNYKTDGTQNEIFVDNAVRNGDGTIKSGNGGMSLHTDSVYYIIGIPSVGSLSLLLETETKVIGGQNKEVGNLNAQGVIPLNKDGIAVDAIPVSETWLPQNDQFGNARPYNIKADIGAVEMQPIAVKSLSAVATKKLYVGVNSYVKTEYVLEQYEPVGEYEYYFANNCNPIVTVNYNNGTSKTYDSQYAAYLDTGEWWSITDNQSYYNQWGIGANQATITLCGVSSNFTVEIIENPVESFTVTLDKTQYIINYDGQETRDMSSGEYYYAYSYWVKSVIVKLKGGDTKTYPYGNGLYDDFGTSYSSSSNQSYQNQWGLGVHTVDFSFMGKTYPVQIEIIESPVASIEILKLPDDTNYIADVEQPNCLGAEIRINYKNSTSETISFNNYNKISFLYPNGIIYDHNQYDFKFLLEGSAVTVDYMGASASFPVSVSKMLTGIEMVKNPEGSYGKGAILSLSYSNGSSEQIELLTNISSSYGAGDMNDEGDDIIFTGGFALTTAGILRVTTNITHKDYIIKNWEINLGSFTDGFIPTDFAFNADYMVRHNVDRLTWIFWNIDGGFNGTVTAGNIDALAMSLIELDSLYSEDGYYSCTVLKAAANKFFKIDGEINFTLSEYYDAEKDAYYSDGWGGDGHHTLEMTEKNADHAVFKYSISWDDEEGYTLNITVDSNGRITSIVKNTPEPDVIISGTYSNLNWTYNLTTKTLTISGEGHLISGSYLYYPTSLYPAPPWAEYKAEIEHIMIETKVSIINPYAFSKMTALKTINLPDTVTFIGDNAFEYTASLKSITLPSSIRELGNYVFKNSGLTGVLDLSNVTAIGEETFLNCVNLTVIKFAPKTEFIGNRAFAGCHGLTNMVLPEDMGYVSGTAFENCRNIILRGTADSRSVRYGKLNSVRYSIYGDLSDDGVLNAVDLVSMRKLMLGLLSNYDHITADVNGNDIVDVRDLIKLKKMV